MNYTTAFYFGIPLNHHDHRKNPITNIVLDKYELNYERYPTMNRNEYIDDPYFKEMFMVDLVNSLKQRLFSDEALQQQVVGNMAKSLCGLFNHQVYDTLRNQCRSFKGNLADQVQKKSYLRKLYTQRRCDMLFIAELTDIGYAELWSSDQLDL